MSTSLILHNIRSAHNVGAIFRTADGAGVTKIFLTGYTPAPTDKFGRVDKTITKTALGAEKIIEWEKVEDIFELIKKLQAPNSSLRTTLIALEQAKNSVDYKTIPRTFLKGAQGESSELAIILGNEVGGIEPEILKECDVVAEIPMHGQKESLNVSVAAGVALFRWLE